MTTPDEADRILGAIRKGIEVARDSERSGDQAAKDEFAAYCAWQELRRAGFRVVPISDLAN